MIWIGIISGMSLGFILGWAFRILIKEIHELRADVREYGGWARQMWLRS